MPPQQPGNSIECLRTVLAVLAHPDDESFLVGGTLSKYSRAGVETRLLCLTAGGQGMLGGSPPIARSALPLVRRGELGRACLCLGLSSVTVLAFPDGGLEQAGALVLAMAIRTHLRLSRPQVVITFEPEGIGDNPDHMAASAATRLALTGSYPGEPGYTQEGRPPHLLYVVVPESEAPAIGRDIHSVPDEDVDLSIDISGEWDRKRAALLCHRSQRRDVLEVFGPDLRGLSKREHFVTAPGWTRPQHRPQTDLAGYLRSVWSRRSMVANDR